MLQRTSVPVCAGAAAAASDAPDRDAMQLQLQELRLDNVDALEALKLVIQVSISVCSCMSCCLPTCSSAVPKTAHNHCHEKGCSGTKQLLYQ